MYVCVLFLFSSLFDEGKGNRRREREREAISRDKKKVKRDYVGRSNLIYCPLISLFLFFFLVDQQQQPFRISETAVVSI